MSRREQEIQIQGKAETITNEQDGVKNAEPPDQFHALRTESAVKEAVPTHAADCELAEDVFDAF